MCDPITMMAVSVVSATAPVTASIYAQNKQAETAANNAKEQAGYDQMISMLNQGQLDEQTSLALTENERRAMRERSQLNVSQAESGLSGLTPLRALANTYIQQGFNEGSILSDSGDKTLNNGLQSLSSVNQAKSTINQAKSSQTGGWMSGLQIGATATQSALSGYTAGKQIQSSKK